MTTQASISIKQQWLITDVRAGLWRVNSTSSLTQVKRTISLSTWSQLLHQHITWHTNVRKRFKNRQILAFLYNSSLHILFTQFPVQRFRAIIKSLDPPLSTPTHAIMPATSEINCCQSINWANLFLVTKGSTCNHAGHKKPQKCSLL